MAAVVTKSRQMQKIFSSSAMSMKDNFLAESQSKSHEIKELTRKNEETEQRLADALQEIEKLKAASVQFVPFSTAVLSATEDFNQDAYCKACTGFDNWTVLKNFFNILN